MKITSFLPNWYRCVFAVSVLSALGCFGPNELLGQAPQSRRPPNSTNTVESEFRIAREAEKKGDYDTAASAYQAILKLNPELAEMHQNLGLVYYLQAKNREA